MRDQFETRSRARAVLLPGMVGIALLAIAQLAAVAGATLCKSATGQIVCVGTSLLVDGETVTIADPTQSATFEFEISGNGVSPGNRPVMLGPAFDADDVRDALAMAIQSTSLLVAVTLDTGTVKLVQTTPGATGNIPIEETVAEPSFVVSGFSGGICEEVPGPSVPIFPVEAVGAGMATLVIVGRLRRSRN